MQKSYLKMKKFTQDSNIIVNVIIKSRGLWQSQFHNIFLDKWT